MSLTLASFIPLFVSYGYVIILPVAILEGPIITVIASFLAAQGYLNVILVYITVVLGDLLGDIMYYALGRFSKKNFINKWGHRFGMNAERIEKIASHFDRHSGKTLMFAKLTHALGWPVLMAAGISEMPLGRFIWFNFLGTLPKCLIFVLIGYYAGYAYQQISSYLDRAFLIIGVSIIVIGILIYLFRKKGKPGNIN